MMEIRTAGENNHPPLFLFFEYMVAKKIRPIKISHATKKYFDRSYLNMLMTGQLKRTAPRTKRNIQISLFIYGIL
ncbi:MAG: hypothetical protein HZB61_11555 [Nitrospirae bacterium]|nr:hypothetical protein [Nitrospirota bacterium]